MDSNKKSDSGSINLNNIATNEETGSGSGKNVISTQTTFDSNSNKQLITIPSLKISTSPDNKININNNKVISSTTVSTSSNNVIKSSTGKPLNIIPIKNLNSQREVTNISPNNYFSNNERIPNDRFSPKPRDIKITASNLSPNQKNKLIPASTKSQTTQNVTNNTGFDTNKYSNKVYTNITNNLMHKSPSPKHNDNTSNKVVGKKSPENPKK